MGAVIGVILVVIVAIVIFGGAITLMAGLVASVIGIALVLALVAGLILLAQRINWKLLLSGYVYFFLRTGAMIGKPGIAISYWRLQQGPTCAINAQRMVLAICGIQKSEAELTMRHEAYGLYRRELGSTDIKNLMTGYGLDARSVTFDTKRKFIRNLFYTLRSGRLAVTSVNAELLRIPDPAFRSEHYAVPNHAIVITGLRNIGNGKYLLYYADSGVPNGQLKTIDAHVMQEAAGRLYVETPKIFEGVMRVWPHQPDDLDTLAIPDQGEGNAHLHCPRCEQTLRVWFTPNVKARCPHCKYVFKVIEQSVADVIREDASPWNKAGRE